MKPSKPDIPIEAFYRSSSLAQLLVDSHQKNKKLKRRDLVNDNVKRSTNGCKPRSFSSTGDRHPYNQKTLLISEINWKDNFNVTASKNNIQVHENYKEFFDRPIQYDVRGYL